MPDRYEDRYRGRYGRERYPDRDDRGFMERAGDEMRSWFGDEEAQRRRERDDRDRERYPRGRAEEHRSWGREYEGRSDPSWERRGGFGAEHGRERSPRWRPEEDWRGGASGTEPYLGGAALGADRGWSTGYGGADIGSRQYRPEPYDERESHGRGGSYGGSYGETRVERQGRFAGRGPKGYQRSDDRIREDVSDRLTDDPMIDASNIEITVRAGEVTLSGVVREREDKRRAEDLVERISGVREVHNSLRVNRAAFENPGDVIGLHGTTGPQAGRSGTPDTTPGGRDTNTRR